MIYSGQIRVDLLAVCSWVYGLKGLKNVGSVLFLFKSNNLYRSAVY